MPTIGISDKEKEIAKEGYLFFGVTIKKFAAKQSFIANPVTKSIIFKKPFFKLFSGRKLSANEQLLRSCLVVKISQMRRKLMTEYVFFFVRVC